MKTLSRLALMTVLAFALVGTASATANTSHPYTGSYMGSSDTGARIHFTYKDGAVHNFTIGRDVFFTVSHVRNFEFGQTAVVHSRHYYVGGKWDGSHYLEGHYSYTDHGHKKIVYFWANAYSS